MEWTLAGLFVISALLLILSIFKSYQVGRVTHTEIDRVHISNLKEISALQESIRNMELDIEVVTKEAGIELSSEEKVFKREIVDLYKRNYSIVSIAEKKQVSESEIEQILAPYQKGKDERGKAANEN